MKTTSTTSETDVPALLIGILEDYLEGQVDPQRDELVRKWTPRHKKRVLKEARKICQK